MEISSQASMDPTSSGANSGSLPPEHKPASAPQSEQTSAKSGLQPTASSSGESRSVGVSSSEARTNNLLPVEPDKPPLASRAHLRLGLWQWSLSEEFSESSIQACLYHLQQATEQVRP